jgi:ribosomal protein S18 acetylase RimI-like enzyme
MSLLIRAARPEEAEALAAIAWAAKGSWGYSEFELEVWREQLTPSAESVRDRPTYVAELRAEVAGFYQLDMDAHPIELEHLWVDPRFMRRGLGRALLSHARAHLAGAGVAELHIDSDPNAVAFYVACGARRVGARPAPIAGQPDRVRPQLRLATAQTTPAIEP